MVPAQQLWPKLQALHETGYEGMEMEKVLKVWKGLVDSLVLRVRKGNPLRLNELVYVKYLAGTQKMSVVLTGERNGIQVR